jgi:hypothetical protein
MVTSERGGPKRHAEITQPGVLGGMMHKILEYGTWVGTGWFASNALFVIVWCWLHSNERPWMRDQEQRPTIFTVHEGDASGQGLPFLPGQLLSGFEPNPMTFDRAS